MKIGITRKEFFRICKESAVADIIYWEKKNLVRFEITGEYDEQYLRELRDARNYYYFLLWKE